MKKPLRRLLIGLTLATAAAAGTLTVTDALTPQRTDTAWGASATTSDTGWGLPPTDDILPIPLDTGWG